MNKEIKPLYRKVNTCARNHHHFIGGNARHDRNTKLGLKKNMAKNELRGLDYTPLYRFLLSKVGSNWDSVYKEAQNRLDNEDAIWHMVVRTESEKYDYYHKLRRYFRSGEASYFSLLYVDENNILQLLDPTLKNEDLTPSCSCCTHTLNGKVLNKKFQIISNGMPNT